jgi:hypothetical protein
MGPIGCQCYLKTWIPLVGSGIRKRLSFAEQIDTCCHRMYCTKYVDFSFPRISKLETIKFNLCQLMNWDMSLQMPYWDMSLQMPYWDISLQMPYSHFPLYVKWINLLKSKRNLLYIRNQSVPRCKHFPLRL